MLAAESVHKALSGGDDGGKELADFEENVKASWAYKELVTGRNFGPGLKKFGNFWGAAFAFIDQNIFSRQTAFYLAQPAAGSRVLAKGRRRKADRLSEAGRGNSHLIDSRQFSFQAPTMKKTSRRT